MDRIKEFKQHLRRSGKSAATIEAYGGDVREFLNFLELWSVVQDEVDVSVLKAFEASLAERDCSNSIRRKIISVRQYFRFLASDHGQPGSVLDDAAIPSRIEYAPHEDTLAAISQLLHSLAPSAASGLKGYRDGSLLALLAYEGIKTSEIIDLQWNHYLPGRDSFLNIPGSRRRTIQLSPESSERLSTYRRHMKAIKTEAELSKSHIYVGFKGRDEGIAFPKITRHGLKFILYAWGNDFDIPKLNAEMLRHHAIQHQIAIGKTPEQIMEHLGLKRLGNVAKHVARENIRQREANP